MDALSKVPDLLGRKFAVGYFIPAVILFAVIWITLDLFGRRPAWLVFESTETLFGATVVLGLCWVLGIVLVGLNTLIVRVSEGYVFEDWPILGALSRIHRGRFRRAQAGPVADQKRVDDARSRNEDPPEVPGDHADRLRRAVERLPHSADAVLPTVFGNKYRAIEVYSHVVYGLDAIPAWSRLIAVIPKEFQDKIEDAKAQLDFALNVHFAGLVGLVVYWVLAAVTQTVPLWPFNAVFAVLIVLGYILMTYALDGYGRYVKSAFDLYRKELADALGLDLPRSPQKEREMWTDVSRVMIYRSAPAWDRLTIYRKNRKATDGDDD